MTSGVLTARGLTRRFGGLLAVADVALTLRPGEPHAVIGPNGAGKTTLIQLLSGALVPSSGVITLDKTDITALPDWRRARLGIGRSFQRANLFHPLTARENIRLSIQSGLRFRDLFQSDSETARRAEPVLAEVGLLAFGDSPVAALSHGQRRLLEIALVLTLEAKVLLLDEPLAGLGAEEVEPVATLLRRLARDRTMLLIEHDMDVVFAVAQIVTVMVDGRVLASGTPAEISRSAAVRDAYLGHAA